MINTTLCYIEHEGKYLMLHRIKKKSDINAGKWIGVGGKFEPGETADECVAREVYEETGLTLIGYERVGLVKFLSDKEEAEDMYLYRGTAFEGSLREDCPEGELKWVPIEQVPDLPTWEGDRYFLKALAEHRTNLNMTVRYEGGRLAEFRDDTASLRTERSRLLTVPHGFSSREGGVSEGIFESLNLGRNRGDEPERVNENWRRFLRDCEIPGNAVVWGRQVHGSYVHVAGADDLRSFQETKAPIEADGFVTDKPGVPLAVFTADCVPVLLQDPKHGVIGAVHSGWRSTVADIGGQVITKMCALGADASEIRIAIGPAIDRCHFEVGPEVIEAVDALLGDLDCAYYRAQGEKFYLDLRGVVRERFQQLGVKAENIELVGGCTMCNPDHYWSHRFTKGERGSQAAVIAIG